MTRPVYIYDPDTMNARALANFAALGRHDVTVAPVRNWGDLRRTRDGEWLLNDCGTDAGYRRHLREHTPVCASCEDAHARANADHRARKRARRHAA